MEGKIWTALNNLNEFARPIKDKKKKEVLADLARDNNRNMDCMMSIIFGKMKFREGYTDYKQEFRKSLIDASKDSNIVNRTVSGDKKKQALANLLPGLVEYLCNKVDLEFNYDIDNKYLFKN